MADALCGPSNALQSFQKHSQVDRTLQQDRLTGPRHAPGQGFRSFDPRSGSLDADFHTFENSQPNPFMLEESLAQPNFYHAPILSHPAASAPAMNWASDFQKMHISDQPIPTQQFRTEAPLVRSAPGGWQNEFMRQRQNGMSTVSQGKQAAFEYQQQQIEGLGPQQFSPYSTFQQQQMAMGTQYGQTDLNQQLDQRDFTQEGHEQVSAQDWSQAFEEALASSSQTQNTASADQILHEDGTYTNDRSQMDNDPLIQQPENIKIGSDAIEYTEMRDRSDEQNAHDAVALARVAGELLHNMQHENDNKFQNSQFLDLMRRIRDRQVEVRNNDFETIQGESISARQQDPSSRPADPVQAGDNFEFPDMNVVNEPGPANDIGYSFDSDDQASSTHPLSQIQALHPGGRLYPGSPEPQHVSMSGGIGPSADDFGKIEEFQSSSTTHSQPAVDERTSLA